MSGYVINVGHHAAQKVLVSQVDKKGNPVGEPIAERNISTGTHLVINRYNAWGRRLLKGERDENGKVKKEEVNKRESQIEFTNPRYAGDVEFLEWGDPNGYLISCRYLKQSKSLDVEYQDNVQKIKIDLTRGEDGVGQIELRNGENKFDYKSDALFIEYLKNHPQNRDSISKNPDPKIKGFTFYEVTDEMVDKSSIERMEQSLDAGLLVRSLSNNSQNIRNLFDLIGKRKEFGDTNNLSKDGDIYKVLLNFASINPTEFMEIINSYKRDLSDKFELAKSHNALDLTKDGFIALNINNKKVVVLEGLKGKGDAMLEYVFQNFTEDRVYKAMKDLKTLTEKLK